MITKKPTRFGSLEWWQRQEREQIAWIESCGGNLAGYIARYGDPDFPRADGKPMLGEGGTAIFNADMNALKKIQERLGESTQDTTANMFGNKCIIEGSIPVGHELLDQYGVISLLLASEGDVSCHNPEFLGTCEAGKKYRITIEEID